MNTGRWAWEGIEVVLASFLPTLCNVEHYCCALSVAMLKANPIRIDSMVQSAFQQGCCPKIEHRLAMLLLTTFNICTFHSGCGILSFTKWHDICPVFCRPLPLSHPLYHDSPIASFFFQIHIVHVLWLCCRWNDADTEHLISMLLWCVPNRSQHFYYNQPSKITWRIDFDEDAKKCFSLFALSFHYLHLTWTASDSLIVMVSTSLPNNIKPNPLTFSILISFYYYSMHTYTHSPPRPFLFYLFHDMPMA